MERPVVLPPTTQVRGLSLVTLTPARVLAAIVVTAAAVRSLVGVVRVTPTYLPDEYMYSALGRSIAESGHPLVRGGSAHFTALLQPLVTAPFWLIGNTDVAYHLVLVTSAVAMSLVAVPVYLVCVAVGLRQATALLAAALAVCAPVLTYAAWLVSEPFAYPLAAGAVAAGTVALGRGSKRAQVLFLVLSGLAAFSRAQLLVLPLAYGVAVLIVAARTRDFRRVAREQIVVLSALLAPLAVVLLMRSRVLGVYEGFGTVDLDPVDTLSRLATNGLILCYGSGWILVPAALVGVVVTLARPRTRMELAFGALATSVGIAVLLQASLWGQLDRPQERYFLYALPWLAPFFALTVERGWPWLRAHSLIAVAMAGLAVAVPLSGYATSVVRMQSPTLFGVYRIEQLLGTGSGALAIAIVASVLALVALTLPRLSAPAAVGLGLGLACAASLSLSVAAANFDLRDSRSVREWSLPGDRSWVDHADVTSATLVRAGASWGDALLQLFWNRSIDRVGLLPGALPPDTYHVDQIGIAENGTLTMRGRPLSGAIVADVWETPVRLRHARRVAASPANELWVPRGAAQLELYALGFYRDGMLKRSGSVHLWPATNGGPVQGRLTLRLIAPRWLEDVVTIRLTPAGSSPLAIRIPPGGSRTVSLRVCAHGRWDMSFAADRATVYDKRPIAAETAPPRWQPDATACTAA